MARFLTARQRFAALSVAAHVVLFGLGPRLLPTPKRPPRYQTIHVVMASAAARRREPELARAADRGEPEGGASPLGLTRKHAAPHGADRAAPLSKPAAAHTSTAGRESHQGEPAGGIAAAAGGDALSSEAVLHAKASYLSELRARIEQAKTYPAIARARGQSGRVEVAFTVAKTGELTGIHIEQPSAFHLLNEAALAAVTAARSFRPLPSEVRGDAWPLVVPIVFKLGD